MFQRLHFRTLAAAALLALPAIPFAFAGRQAGRTAPAGPAPPAYTITMLPSAMSPAEPARLNNRSEVLAGASGNLWKNGVLIDLSPVGAPSSVRALNDRGEVLISSVGLSGIWKDTNGDGVASTTERTLFDQTTPLGALRNLEDLNDQGICCGFGTIVAPFDEVLFGPGSAQMTDLDPTRKARGNPLFLNNGNVSAGTGHVEGNRGGIRYRPGAAPELLQGPPGLDAGDPTGINDSGLIVGFSGQSHDLGHACSWSDTTAQDLHPPGFSFSVAEGVNSSGDIIGWGKQGSEYHILLWRGTALTDLGALGGGSLTDERRARDINDRGEILGYRVGHGLFLATPEASVKGKIEYEKIPVTNNGLRLNQPQRKPAAGVVVEARQADTGDELGSAVTDDEGRYELAVTSTVPIRLRVKAEMEEAPAMGKVEVRNDANNEPWFFDSEPFTPGQEVSAEHDLLIPDADRSSGPFNLLAVVRKAHRFVRQFDENLETPPLNIFWHPDRRSGTFFVDNQAPQIDALFVNGDRNVNSDEFDDTIVAHEYGHFLARNFSRDSSFGGLHSVGLQLDPRVAWSEGWANFFGCASMESQFRRNTYGPNGRQVQRWDLERNVLPGDRPGLTSEQSVATALWDLFDNRADAGDSVALEFGPIWGVMRGGLRQATFVYLIDFCEVLFGEDSSLGPNLRSILRKRQIRYTPGGTPPVPEPFPLPIASGEQIRDVASSVTPQGGQGNLATSSRFYEFTLEASSPVTVLLNFVRIGGGARADLDLLLYRGSDETLVAASTQDNPQGGGEQISTQLEPGTYVIEVRSWSELNPGFSFNRARFTLVADY